MHSSQVPKSRTSRVGMQRALDFPATLLNDRITSITVPRPDFSPRHLYPLVSIMQDGICHFMGTFPEGGQTGALERFKSHLRPSGALPTGMFYSADGQGLFIPTFSSWRKAGAETNMAGRPNREEFESISSLISILEHAALISPEISSIQANHLLSSPIKSVSLLMDPKENTPLRAALSQMLDSFDELPKIPLIGSIVPLIPSKPHKIVIVVQTSQIAALVGLKLAWALKRHVYCSSSPFKRHNPDFRDDVERLLKGEPYGITVIHDSPDLSTYIRKLLKAADIAIFIGKKVYPSHEANANPELQNIYVLGFEGTQLTNSPAPSSL